MFSGKYRKISTNHGQIIRMEKSKVIGIRPKPYFDPEKYFVKLFTFDLINALIGEIFKRWEISKALILGILSKNTFIFAIFKKMREYF